jgi:dipeptidase D
MKAGECFQPPFSIRVPPLITHTHTPHDTHEKNKNFPSVLAWLKAFADDRGLAWTQDTVGNIVIRRPGSGGGQDAPPVVIQGHVDMVCEKNAGTAHDFAADPIRLVLGDDGWLRADGTTLGADNGIGVAAALAVLDSPPGAPLPPLEALFTVDEETGLTGAFGLDGSMLTGRTLLNLDTEDWGAIFIGCAGGGDSMITLPVQASTDDLPPDATALTLSVTGLLGGHSGLCIAEGRGNAVALAARLAEAAIEGAGGPASARLVRAAGGDKRNAIPRECRVSLAIVDGGPAAVDAAIVAAEKEGAAIAAEYGGLETGLAVGVAKGDGPAPTAALSAESTAAAITLLRILPHGPLRMSTAVPGLVETSTNLASITPVFAAEVEGRADDDGALPTAFRVQTSTRSSLLPALEAVRRTIGAAARLAGASAVECDEAYPGWAPNPASRIVRLTAGVVAGVTGAPPSIGAIHAGLECGIISARVPGGLDCVSFGPTITGAHSPDEAVDVKTVVPFYEALLKLLAELAGEKAEGEGAPAAAAAAAS